MHVLYARNVTEAYHEGGVLLRERGVRRPSRYGDVLELDVPVTTHYTAPRERVLFDAKRDANPFFHLFEALWILGGRYDVAYLAQFLPRIAEFSDDGRTFHAPYGYRLRHAPLPTTPEGGTFDQLREAIRLLKADPTTRQVVLAIWDPARDLGASTKDVPCNDTLKFEARDGKLNLVVFCRSNDMIWGAYGANVVQFSMLQEYVAASVGLPVGYYEQISCNFHAYVDVWDAKQPWTAFPEGPYETGAVAPFPLIEDPARWDRELPLFLQRSSPDSASPGASWGAYSEPFFRDVAAPMYAAHQCVRRRNWRLALDYLDGVRATDWRLAGATWVRRRAEARSRALSTPEPGKSSPGAEASS